jgi:hypothetical protein
VKPKVHFFYEISPYSDFSDHQEIKIKQKITQNRVLENKLKVIQQVNGNEYI